MENIELLDFIGSTYSAKVDNRIWSAIADIHKDSGDFRAFPLVLNHGQTDSLAYSEIKAIGTKIKGDLFTDQFGTWLAALLRQPKDQGDSVSIKNTANTAKTVQVWDAASNTTTLFNRKNSSGAISIGTSIQIGKGTTTPARTDVAITTAFSSSPESTKFSTAQGIWTTGSGIASALGSIVAAGSDDIKESGFIATWADTAATAQDFLLTHELISPTVSFVTNDTLSVNYKFTLA